MIVRKLIVALMATVLSIGFAGVGLSAQAINGLDVDGPILLASWKQQEVRGTVSKIEGTQITVVDEKGEQITIKVSDPETLDIKVGDRVLVKGGKVIKE